MKILCLADLHLGKPRGDLKRFGTTDVEIALASLRCLVESELPDAVIIAGDIFNSTTISPEENHLLAIGLRKALSIVPSEKVYAIRGNHDRASYSILADTCLYTDLCIQPVEIKNGVTISGCDYINADQHREYLSEKRSDIMVCHMPMSPFASFGENNVSVTECPEDCVVVVGDTHVPSVYAKDSRCVISPGCLFPADKTEILNGVAGSCYMLEIDKVDGELSVDIVHHCLETRKGYDLSAIKVQDELLGGLDNIKASTSISEAFPAVVYYDESLATPDDPLFTFIPVKDSSKESVESVDVDGLGDSDVFGKIDKVLSKLLASDPDSAVVSEFVKDLIMSDDADAVVSGFIKRVKIPDNSTETAL